MEQRPLGKILDVSSKKINSGRKRKYDKLALENIKAIDLHKRQTLRGLSCNINIPLTSCWRLLKQGFMKRHTSSLKPLLTDANKAKRINFFQTFIWTTGLFKDMLNYIHIDEKWFHLTQINQRLYLLPDEKVPSRICKSKRFISKVMFMAAVARPRYDSAKKQYFDEKISIWTFTYKAEAK